MEIFDRRLNMEGVKLEFDPFGKKWGELCQLSESGLTFLLVPPIGSEYIAKVGAQNAKNVTSFNPEISIDFGGFDFDPFNEKVPI